MARTFEAKLSLAGMRDLKKQLVNYRKNTLTDCVNDFVNALIDDGIQIAYLNTGEFDGYIGFFKEIPTTKYNYQTVGYLIGRNTQENISRWLYKGQIKEVEVSSILMAEFGSGRYARSGWRGTFPNQKHAFEDSWHWTPVEDGVIGTVQTSEGTSPSMPMYKAALEMKSRIYEIAKTSFERIP